MARSIDQIVAELNTVYNPQIEQVNKQLAELPAYYTAQQGGLEQAKTNAFNDITNTASAKGMSYSGMPIAEQARYTGTKFLPAMAQLQQQQSQQTYGLKGQLTDIYGKRMSQAQALQQEELNREEQARQFELKRQDEERRYQQQLAAQRASAASRGSRAPSAADRMQAAQQAFGQAYAFAKSNPGKVQDGYREIVQQQVGQQYGLDPKTLGALSGQYFPNGWEWQAGIRK